MCTGIELAIAGAVLGGGSYYAQQRAQDRVADKQAAVQRLEWERQDSLQGEAQAIFDQTLNDSGAEGQNDQLKILQDQKAEEAIRRTPGTTARDYLPGTSGTNTVINRSTQNTNQSGDSERKRRAALAAILDAYNDVRTTRDITQDQSRSELARTANFAKGSSGVAQQEIAAKANDTGFWGVLAPILSGASSATLSAAGGAGFGAGGASATTTGTTAIANPNIPGTQYLI